ncbi:hypothetical protein FNF29_07458 [Cafeteria roenbergensis]|uniref:Uncharacterized protein n=1 Tax=Cafeteria roenbergensis TaxID=33653 RepID=A0A5A8C423_CAFRO|nr:hypothetical protein FNF29_07458 [Cafeteria roenbergensis]|eukprot:KAA0147289.1 hypothetical protein FNF29_07458 [Cafeteria roenbergensis]
MAAHGGGAPDRPTTLEGWASAPGAWGGALSPVDVALARVSRVFAQPRAWAFAARGRKRAARLKRKLERAAYLLSEAGNAATEDATTPASCELSVAGAATRPEHARLLAEAEQAAAGASVASEDLSRPDSDEESDGTKFDAGGVEGGLPASSSSTGDSLSGDGSDSGSDAGADEEQVEVDALQDGGSPPHSRGGRDGALMPGETAGTRRPRYDEEDSEDDERWGELALAAAELAAAVKAPSEDAALAPATPADSLACPASEAPTVPVRQALTRLDAVQAALPALSLFELWCPAPTRSSFVVELDPETVECTGTYSPHYGPRHPASLPDLGRYWSGPTGEPTTFWRCSFRRRATVDRVSLVPFGPYLAVRYDVSLLRRDPLTGTLRVVARLGPVSIRHFTASHGRPISVRVPSAGGVLADAVEIRMHNYVSREHGCHTLEAVVVIGTDAATHDPLSGNAAASPATRRPRGGTREALEALLATDASSQPCGQADDDGLPTASSSSPAAAAAAELQQELHDAMAAGHACPTLSLVLPRRLASAAMAKLVAAAADSAAEAAAARGMAALLEPRGSADRAAVARLAVQLALEGQAAEPAEVASCIAAAKAVDQSPVHLAPGPSASRLAPGRPAAAAGVVSPASGAAAGEAAPPSAASAPAAAPPGGPSSEEAHASPAGALDAVLAAAVRMAACSGSFALVLALARLLLASPMPHRKGRAAAELAALLAELAHAGGGVWPPAKGASGADAHGPADWRRTALSPSEARASAFREGMVVKLGRAMAVPPSAPSSASLPQRLLQLRQSSVAWGGSRDSASPLDSPVAAGGTGASDDVDSDASGSGGGRSGARGPSATAAAFTVAAAGAAATSPWRSAAAAATAAAPATAARPRSAEFRSGSQPLGAAAEADAGFLGLADAVGLIPDNPAAYGGKSRPMRFAASPGLCDGATPDPDGMSVRSSTEHAFAATSSPLAAGRVWAWTMRAGAAPAAASSGVMFGVALPPVRVTRYNRTRDLMVYRPSNGKTYWAGVKLRRGRVGEAVTIAVDMRAPDRVRIFFIPGGTGAGGAISAPLHRASSGAAPAVHPCVAFYAPQRTAFVLSPLLDFPSLDAFHAWHDAYEGRLEAANARVAMSTDVAGTAAAAMRSGSLSDDDATSIASRFLPYGAGMLPARAFRGSDGASFAWQEGGDPFDGAPPFLRAPGAPLTGALDDVAGSGQPSGVSLSDCVLRCLASAERQNLGDAAADPGAATARFSGGGDGVLDALARAGRGACLADPAQPDPTKDFWGQITAALSDLFAALAVSVRRPQLCGVHPQACGLAAPHALRAAMQVARLAVVPTAKDADRDDLSAAVATADPTHVPTLDGTIAAHSSASAVSGPVSLHHYPTPPMDATGKLLAAASANRLHEATTPSGLGMLSLTGTAQAGRSLLGEAGIASGPRTAPGDSHLSPVAELAFGKRPSPAAAAATGLSPRRTRRSSHILAGEAALGPGQGLSPASLLRLMETGSAESARQAAGPVRSRLGPERAAAVARVSQSALSATLDPATSAMLVEAVGGPTATGMALLRDASSAERVLVALTEAIASAAERVVIGPAEAASSAGAASPLASSAALLIAAGAESLLDDAVHPRSVRLWAHATTTGKACAAASAAECRAASATRFAAEQVLVAAERASSAAAVAAALRLSASPASSARPPAAGGSPSGPDAEGEDAACRPHHPGQLHRVIAEDGPPETEEEECLEPFLSGTPLERFAHSGPALEAGCLSREGEDPLLATRGRAVAARVGPQGGRDASNAVTVSRREALITCVVAERQGIDCKGVAAAASAASAALGGGPPVELFPPRLAVDAVAAAPPTWQDGALAAQAASEAMAGRRTIVEIVSDALVSKFTLADAVQLARSELATGAALGGTHASPLSRERVGPDQLAPVKQRAGPRMTAWLSSAAGTAPASRRHRAAPACEALMLAATVRHAHPELASEVLSALEAIAAERAPQPPSDWLRIAWERAMRLRAWLKEAGERSTTAWEAVPSATAEPAIAGPWLGAQSSSAPLTQRGIDEAVAASAACFSSSSAPGQGTATGGAHASPASAAAANSVAAATLVAAAAGSTRASPAGNLVASMEGVLRSVADPAAEAHIDLEAVPADVPATPEWFAPRGPPRIRHRLLERLTRDQHAADEAAALYVADARDPDDLFAEFAEAERGSVAFAVCGPASVGSRATPRSLDTGRSRASRTPSSRADTSTHFSGPDATAAPGRGFGAGETVVMGIGGSGAGTGEGPAQATARDKRSSTRHAWLHEAQGGVGSAADAALSIAVAMPPVGSFVVGAVAARRSARAAARATALRGQRMLLAGVRTPEAVEAALSRVRDGLRVESKRWTMATSSCAMQARRLAESREQAKAGGRGSGEFGQDLAAAERDARSRMDRFQTPSPEFQRHHWRRGISGATAGLQAQCAVEMTMLADAASRALECGATAGASAERVVHAAAWALALDWGPNDASVLRTARVVPALRVATLLRRGAVGQSQAHGMLLQELLTRMTLVPTAQPLERQWTAISASSQAA